MRIDKLPVDMQIAAAVAKKEQTVQRQLGEAAVQLIEGAAEVSPGPTADGRGSLINTRA